MDQSDQTVHLAAADLEMMLPPSKAGDALCLREAWNLEETVSEHLKISHEALSEVSEERTQLTDSAKHTYLLNADHFCRWLQGQFTPGS